MNSKSTSNFTLAIAVFLVSLIVPFSVAYNITWHHTLVACCLGSYLLCVTTWISSGCRLVSVYTAFILYALFSNLGQSILYCFTDDPLLVNLYSEYNLKSIIDSLVFQFKCVSAMNLGVAFYLRYDNRAYSAQTIIDGINRGPDIKAPNDFLYKVLFISLLVVCYVCINYLILRQSMSYNELTEAEGVINEVPRFFTAVLGIYFLFRYPKDKRVSLIIYAFWIFYILSLFIVGRRSIAILYVGLMALCLPITHPQLFKKRYRLAWVGFFLFFISMINVLSMFRTQGFSSGAIDSQGFVMNMANSISEFGLSQRPIIITMQGIEQGTPYYQTILYEILHGFIPTDVLAFFDNESRVGMRIFVRSAC